MDTSCAAYQYKSAGTGRCILRGGESGSMARDGVMSALFLRKQIYTTTLLWVE